MSENHSQNQSGSPSGGEMFVGLNILSKIGVIFMGTSKNRDTSRFRT